MSYWNGHRWEAQTPPTAEVKSATPSRAKRVGVAVLEAALVTALTFGLIAGSTFAGRGGGGSGGGGGKHSGGGTAGGTLSLVVLSDGGSAGASWGDTVTYDVSKVGVPNPFITTTCVQGGVNVLIQYAGYYDTYYWPAAKDIILSSADYWTSGAATCTAVVSNSSVKLVYDVAG
jgi:hypothetical protein